jgi:hypothetical protein
VKHKLKEGQSKQPESLTVSLPSADSLLSCHISCLTIPPHRNLSATCTLVPLANRVGITVLITLNTRLNKHSVFLPREREPKLLRIIRLQPTCSIARSADTEIIVTRGINARGASCALVEEWVRVTGLWAGGRPFEVASRVAVGAGCAVKGTIVTLLLLAHHPKLSQKSLTNIFSWIFVTVSTFRRGGVAGLTFCCALFRR